jgi:glycosyltransferase involved in cell wall biosynthesis
MRIIAQVNRVKPFSYYWLNAHLEAFTIPRSDGVVCITRYTEDAVKDLAKQTWIVPNAVDSKFFDVQRNPSEPPEILLVGAVSYRKNQNAFIRALDPLASKLNFKVTFLGGVDREDAYGKEFLSLIETRPWCAWGGFASREELRAKLARAAAVALPSLEDNCPMAVLESIAAGVPVVAGNVGGVPELISHDETGILCDPTNATSMAEAVERVLTDRSGTAQIAARAKEHAANFHPQRIASRHLEIYRQVIAPKRR